MSCMFKQEAQKVITSGRGVIVSSVGEPGISTACTAASGRQCKIITSECSALQGVIKYLNVD